MVTLPYKRITHATYVRAREPKWNEALASPPRISTPARSSVA
jgi:hypothetical protein